MSRFLLSLLVFMSINSIAQKTESNFGDPHFYLIDSLDLNELDSLDRHIIDSCFTVYHAEVDDTSKAAALAFITNAIMYENWHVFLFAEEKGLNKLLLKKHTPEILEHLRKSLAQCYYYIGYFYYGDQSSFVYDIDSTYAFLFKSLRIYEEYNDSEGIRGVSNNIGSYYRKQGNIEEALKYYYRCLKIDEESGDKLKLSNSYNILGGVAQDQNEPQLAIEHYKNALKYGKEEGHKYYIASALTNLGNVYLEIFEKDSLKIADSSWLFMAEANYIEGLENFRAINHSFGKASGLMRLGNIEFIKQEYLKALSLYEESLGHFISIKNDLGKSTLQSKLAATLLKLGQVKKAKEYGLQSLEIALKIDYPDYIKSSAELMSEIYLANGEGEKALEMFKLYIKKRDEIYNEEALKATIQEQSKHEYEKQKAIDDLKNEQLLIIEKEEKEKQQIIALSSSAGAALALMVIIVLLKANRRKQKDKVRINEQRILANQQKDIAQKNFELAENARLQIEIKNEEILASIKYAKRLQEAVLPPQKLVKEWLTNSFILYKPKDIVSGDFYWMETANYELDGKKHSIIFFAAADCTGHGVPGAMVSVVCAGALNRAVNEFNLTDVGEILDKVSALVIDTFKKSDEEVKDGMDIALCGLDIGKKILQYTGANNPLWIVSPFGKLATEVDYKTYQNSVIEKRYLHEVKATRKPVGLSDTESNFKTNLINLNPGDHIYIFSDGYVDQFGGEQGKKFKSMNLKNLLLENFDKPMEHQKRKLDETFEKWRGDLEQIDDVCILGVKINGKERENFTKRELEVVEYLLTGLPSKLIADKMNISTHTVDTYRRRLLAKTNTYNTTELINYCKAKEIV